LYLVAFRPDGRDHPAMGSGVDVRDGRPVLVQRRDDAEQVAALLRRIAGPGVPAVLEVAGGVLVTEWTPPLAEPYAAVDLAGIAAAVGRAHAVGVAHGPFLPEHLRSGPQVTGWGEAPEGWGEADDVLDLAAVLEGAGHRSLAARAAAEDPAARPGMAAIAESLVPVAAPLQPKRTPVVRGRRRFVMAAAAVPVLAVAAVSLRAGDEPPLPSPTSTTTTVPPFDGRIEHAGRRYAVGEPGDVVLLGDWDCDGTASPVVHRPATGQVWRFDAWPETTTPLAPAVVSTGAADVAVRRSGDCDQLVVVEG
jgi:hypothetical protein